MNSKPPTPPPITYVKAACHCGVNEFRAAFHTAELPISNDLCHCSTCRHSSGQMAVYHVGVASLLCVDTDEPFQVDGNDGKGDLVAYRTSPDGVRYFCSICSAHLFFRYLREGEEEKEGGKWCVAAGSLERTEGIVQVGFHIWVEDTLDGGLADHLRTIGGVELPRYARGPASNTLPLGWIDESLITQPHDLTPLDPKNDSLHFTCHCRSVQFKITRPNAQSYLPYAAFPDLLRPHDITHLAKIRNPRNVKWWLRPLDAVDPPKYLAGHCGCTQCRLTSGFEIQSWAYIPLSNVVDEENRPIVLREPGHDGLSDVMDKLSVQSGRHSPQDLPPPTRMTGLKQYISSPGRYREFCKKCGATAFSWQIREPDTVCVAVGLVDERHVGAKAESWFDWCLSRVAYAEQVGSIQTAEGLAAGLEEKRRELGIADPLAGLDDVLGHLGSRRSLSPGPIELGPSQGEVGPTVIEGLVGTA